MRTTVAAIILATLPASAVLAVTATTVSFQNGFNGYTGTIDRYINDATGDTGFTIAETDGSAVSTIILNGYNAGSGAPPTRTAATPDSQGLIRFGNIFGSGAGQIPTGAYILDAQLQLVTAGGTTTSAVGQSTIAGFNGTTTNTITGSNGPFGVSGLTTPFDSTTSYYTSYPLSSARGPYYTEGSSAYATRPVAGIPSAGVGEIATAHITSIVQQWSNGTLANNGLAVQAGFDGVSDDWHIHTTGFSTPEGRPKLTVSYTTDPVTVNTFQPGVGGYSESSVSMARVVGNNVSGATPATTDGSTITGIAFLDGAEKPTATTNEQLALVKFSNVFGGGAGQAPADKLVAKAWLVITTGAASNNRSNDPYDVDIVQRNWTTSSLYTDFGSTPGLQFSDGDIKPSISRVAGAANGSEAWFDVTSYLEGVRNGATDNGVSIRPRQTDGWGIAWNGNTDPTIRPRLVVVSQNSSGSLGGDFNGDTKVDAADFVAWRKGQVPTTQANYDLWRANFGSSGGGTPTPSPSTVVNYDLVDIPNTLIASVPASDAATGTSGLALTRGPGIASSTATLTNGFSANNMNRGASAGHDNAVSSGDYFQFGFSTDASHTASLSTLDLALRRSAVAAPFNFEVQASLDGFATAGQVISDFQYLGRTSGNAPEPAGVLTNPFVYMTADTGGRPNATTSYGDQIPTIDLSAFSFLQNIPANKTVTFRLFAWGDSTTAASNTLALGRMNGPRITGFIHAFPGAGTSLVAVPEPSSAFLVGVVALAFGARRSRRR